MCTFVSDSTSSGDSPCEIEITLYAYYGTLYRTVYVTASRPYGAEIMATTMIYMAPLVKWHNYYDMLMLKQKMVMKLRCYALNAYKQFLIFILFTFFRYIEICH